MKKGVLFLVSLLVVTTMVAAPVSQQRAMQVAQQFIPVPDAQAQAPGMRAEEQPANIVYTHPMPKSGNPAFYVVNVGGSFVIVSADDMAHPVLGYNLGKRWPVAANEEVQLPPQVKGFFDDLAAQMEAAIEANPNHIPDAEWPQPQSAPRRRMMSELPDSVGPLLTTTWDQGQYYNALCPEDQNSPYDGHCPTGCVATAMAQIINYWGNQVQTRGIHSYETDYGTLTVNFDSAHYDFVHMPAQLTDSSSPQEIQAVATLMRDCGVAAVMNYGATVSTSYEPVARVALINFFRFSPNLSQVSKKYFSKDEWIEMLHSDIIAGRPIYYGGEGSDNHAFICDGYKLNNFFHFNFGWNGYADGWYQINAISPEGRDFNSNQTALIGIAPDNYGNVILGHMKGTSTYTIEEPIEFKHLLGNNNYLGDASINDCHSYVYLYLSDTTKQIGVDIVQFQDQHVNLIDTIGYGYRDIWSYGDYYTPFLCSTNFMKMEYIGNFYPDGFHLHIGESGDCKLVNNIGYTIDTTSVKLTWQENGSATQWEIEYGLKGFVIGQGVTIFTEDTIARIGNLQKDCTYDFYIRSMCSDTIFSEWNKVTIRLSPYWTDVVLNTPEGYIEDANGNVSISSAEGLAWLAVQVNGLHGLPAQNFVGKTITLTQNIDLSRYRWNPIGRYWTKSNDYGYTAFLGTFDGGNHTISNICVRDTNSMLGLFGAITSGGYGDIDVVIKNIVLKDGSVECISHNGKDPYYLGGWGCLGGLIGYGIGKISIDNCHSSVNVKGRSRLASLCGSVTNMQEDYGFIRNCSANGNVTGYWTMGEIVGDLYGNILLENCFSYGEIIEDTTDVDDLWGRGAMGGLVGALADATVANSYSITRINHQTNASIGSCVGEMYADHPLVKNVYGTSQDSLSVVGSYSGRFLDLATFNINEWILDTIIAIQDSSYSMVLDVLNAYVYKENNPELSLWKKELTDSLVVFDAKYVPSCYNPTNIHIGNATQVGDSIISTKIEWEQEGSPERWEVLYVTAKQSIDSGVIISVNSNPCVLTGIPVGRPLDFYVRAWCDTIDHSSWSGPFTYMPDKLRWTEVVTSQPEGYQEDSNGNVYISSAEGLAWLSSLANGLNGNQYNSENFYHKRIYLMSDIDLGEYRWTSIGINWSTIFYCKLFEGNGHTISGLYCNELIDNQGLFGCSNVTVKNLLLNQCNINGAAYVGAVGGYIMFGDVVNCGANGTICGIETVGGVLGRHLSTNNGYDPNNYIANSYFVGNVITRHDITEVNTTQGYVGGICGTPFYDTIVNCYLVSEIADTVVYSGIITGTGGSPNMVSNCYYKDYETNNEITHSGCYSVNNSSFTGEGNVWTLNSPPSIKGVSYTNLIDALNAWVNANNSDSIYCNWVADTAMVNGGFPIFAPMPVEPVGPGTEIDNYKKTNRPARKIFERGQLYILLPDGTRYDATGRKVD